MELPHAHWHRLILRATGLMFLFVGLVVIGWSVVFPQDHLYLGRVFGQDVPLDLQWSIGVGVGAASVAIGLSLLSSAAAGWWLCMLCGAADVVQGVSSAFPGIALATVAMLAYLVYVRPLFTRRLF